MEMNLISFPQVPFKFFDFEEKNAHISRSELLINLCDETLQAISEHCCGHLNAYISPNRALYYDLYCSITSEKARRYSIKHKWLENVSTSSETSSSSSSSGNSSCKNTASSFIDFFLWKIGTGMKCL